MRSLTPDTDKIKSLLIKVNELAKRGVGGEREAARLKLQELLMEYDIDISDIEDLVEKRWDFGYKSSEGSTILAQCIWDVKSDVDIKQSKRKRQLYCILTGEQYVEVKEKYRHYWKQYKEQKDRFITAFLVKNQIGLDSPDPDTEPTSKEEIAKIATMMNGIEATPYDAPKMIEE